MSLRIEDLKNQYWINNEIFSIKKLKKFIVKIDFIFLSIYHQLMNNFAIKTGIEVRDQLIPNLNQINKHIKDDEKMTWVGYKALINFRKRNSYFLNTDIIRKVVDSNKQNLGFIK
jgi:hypothetical protein